MRTPEVEETLVGLPGLFDRGVLVEDLHVLQAGGDRQRRVIGGGLEGEREPLGQPADRAGRGTVIGNRAVGGRVRVEQRQLLDTGLNLGRAGGGELAGGEGDDLGSSAVADQVQVDGVAGLEAGQGGDRLVDLLDEHRAGDLDGLAAGDPAQGGPVEREGGVVAVGLQRGGKLRGPGGGLARGLQAVGRGADGVDPERPDVVRLVGFGDGRLRVEHGQDDRVRRVDRPGGVLTVIW